MGELLRRRVVHGELAEGPVEREEHRRGVARALLAHVRVVRRAHGGGDPHAAPVVEHRVVDVVPARPQDLVAPIGRGLRHLRVGRDGSVRIADGQWDLARRIVGRVQDGQVVGAQLQRAVDQAVRVESGFAPVGRDLVVEVDVRIGPIPFSDDHVALDALRPGRRGRHLAGGDAVGPVREHRIGASPELVGAGHHVAACLSRQDPPLPRGLRRLDRVERLGDLPRRLVSELMTGPAASRLEVPQPLRLAADLRRDAVAGRPAARELALVGHAQQREPVAGRVVLGRRARVGRGDRGQVHDLSRRRLDLRRIDQAVAAHPDAVARLREVGQDVPPPVVGDHDPGELRRQLGRLRDHPHARLGSARAGDGAADVVGVDRDRITGGGGWAGAGAREQRDHSDRETQVRLRRSRHGVSPFLAWSSNRGPMPPSLLRAGRRGGDQPPRLVDRDGEPRVSSAS